MPYRRTLCLLGLAALGGALPGLARATSPTPSTASPPTLGAAATDIEKLPGKVALLVTENGKTLAAHNDSTPLAVGSAAKLAVMAALKKAYAGGSLKPGSVFELQAGDKLPGEGLLQSWPDGTPLTAASAANLAAGINDASATDLLVRVLGRPAVDAELPARDRPYLTPRETAILKAPANAALAASWKQASTPAAREHVLAQIDGGTPPAPGSVGPMPHDPSIGVFYTARELCTQLAAVADMPAMAIPSGIRFPSWKRVAYDAGSAPGALNFTLQLETDGGTRYCVAVTWNVTNEPSRYKFTQLVVSLVRALAH